MNPAHDTEFLTDTDMQPIHPALAVLWVRTMLQAACDTAAEIVRNEIVIARNDAEIARLNCEIARNKAKIAEAEAKPGYRLQVLQLKSEARRWQAQEEEFTAYAEELESSPSTARKPRMRPSRRKLRQGSR